MQSHARCVAGYFGRGIYLTTHFNYAMTYTHPTNRILVVCWVLAGNAFPVIEDPIPMSAAMTRQRSLYATAVLLISARTAARNASAQLASLCPHPPQPAMECQYAHRGATSRTTRLSSSTDPPLEMCGFRPRLRTSKWRDSPSMTNSCCPRAPECCRATCCGLAMPE